MRRRVVPPRWPRSLAGCRLNVPKVQHRPQGPRMALPKFHRVQRMLLSQGLWMKSWNHARSHHRMMWRRPTRQRNRRVQDQHL